MPSSHRGARALACVAVSIALGSAFTAQAQTQAPATTSPATTTATTAQPTDPEKQHLADLRKQATPLWSKKTWPELEALLETITTSPQATERDYRRLAAVLEQQGKFAPALALRTASMLREPNNAAGHNGICWHWLQQNQPLKGREYCQKSVALDNTSFAATVNLGHTFLLANDEAQAKRWYQETLAIISTEAELNDGPIDDFKLFIKNGWQVQQSSAYQQWFLQGWSALQDSKIAVAKNIKLVREGKPEEALQFVEKAFALRSNWLGADHPNTLISMGNLAYTYSALGQHDKALALNEKTLTARQTKLGADHPDTLASMSYLASTYSALGQHDKALALEEKTLAARQTKLGADHPDTLTSMGNLAVTYSTLGQNDKALAMIPFWKQGIERLRNKLSVSEEIQQRFFTYYADGYQAWARKFSQQGRSVEGFDLGDQSKARSLIDTLKAQSALRSLPAVKQTIVLELRARSQSQGKLLEQMLVSNNATGERLLAQQKVVDGINGEYAVLDVQLKALYPKYAAMSDLPSASASLAPQLLSDNEVFVSYLVRQTGEAQVFMLTQAGKVQWVDLGSLPNLGSTVAASRELISPSRAGSVQGLLLLLKTGGYAWLLPAQALPDGATIVANAAPAAQALLQQYWHDKLIKPVLPLAGAFPRWIISPDKDLALLPFDTLLEAAPAPAAGAPSSAAVPLVQARNLTVVQSFSVYALLKAREAEYAKLARPKALFAMGNAVYGDGWAQSRGMTRGAGQVQAWRSTDADLLQSLRSSSAAGQGEPMKLAGEQTLLRKLAWQNLPGTGREVEAVSSVFAKTGGADTMVGAQASEAQLLALNASGKLRDYRYLLFSAHGYLAQNPSLSALVLSQVGNAADHDGYITAEKWPLYDVRSDLTVLSACDTGAGKTQAGEGVMGLPYALFVAGNKNTLLSLWPVDDDATAEFMRLFFEKLHPGMPQPQALAETKRAFMRSALWSEPRYWAAFVLYGV